MAKKFTASDIEKLQKKNEDTVKNQVIPSLNKSTGAGNAPGLISSYQPSDVKQQRTIIDTRTPIVKTTTPQQTKTTSNTVTLGGKTFTLNNDVNKGQSTSIGKANSTLSTPGRQVKNNTREYKYGSQNTRTALASLGTAALYKPLQALEGAANLGKSYSQSIENKVKGTKSNGQNLDFRLLEKRNNLNEGGRAGVGENKGFDKNSFAKDVGISSLFGSQSLATGLGKNVGKQLANNPQTTYDIGQNLAEMATTYGLGHAIAGPVGSGVLAAGAMYDEALKNALDKGDDINTATKYATLMANIEGAMASVGLNGIEESIAKEGASAGRQMLGSTISEAIEEMAQGSLEEVADDIFHKKNSDDYLEYMSYKNNGMSDKEAIFAVAKNRAMQRLQEGVAGGLFGAAFSGLNSLGSNFTSNTDIPQLEQNNANSQWLSDAETQRLLDEAEMSRNAELENANNNILNNVANYTDELSNVPTNNADVPDSALELLQQNIENTITNNDVNNVPVLENNTEITPEDVKSIEREIAAIDEQLYSLGESGNDAKYNELMARKKELYSQLPTPTNRNFENTRRLAELLNASKNNQPNPVDSYTTNGYNLVDERGNVNGQVSEGYDGRRSEELLPGIRPGRGMGETRLGNDVEGRSDVSSDSVQFAEQLNGNKDTFDANEMNNMAQKGIEPVNFKSSNNNAGLFAKALDNAKKNNPNGAAVDAHSVEEIQKIIDNGGYLFLYEDGTAGGAVEGNGNLTAVFKDSRNPVKRMGTKIALSGVKNGAVKGDCFGKFLVNTYSRAGFEPVARMSYGYGFNEAMDAQVKRELAEGIIAKEPDVYAIKLRDGYDYNKAVEDYPNAKRYTQEELDQLPLFDDYDEMLAYRDSLIKQPGTEQGAFFNGDNTIPSLNGDTSMAIQQEIANGTMGYDEEGNLEAYESKSMNDLPELPKADEPYVSVIDMLEGKNELNNVPDSASVQFDDEITPNNVNSNKRLSDVATNTAVNNDFYSQSEIRDNPTIRAVAEYTVEGEQESMNEAINRVINDGYKWEQDYVNGTAEINTNKDVDTAMCLLTELNNQIDVARYGNDTKALKALEARKLALFSKVREAGTKYGKVIQAYAKWNRTADGAMLNSDTIIDNSGKAWAKHNTRKAERNKQISNKLLSALNKLVDDGTTRVQTEYTLDEIKEQVRNTLDKEYGSVAKQFNDSDMDFLANLIDQGAKVDELANALNRKFATGIFGISSETQAKVNDLFENAKRYGENSRDRVELETEAYKLLANELAGTGTFIDKFNAWRYLAMLGNPKTHIRNIMGNTIFRAMTSTSDTLAAAMEATIDKTSKAFGGQGIERTKSILNPLNAEDKALISASNKDAVDSNYRILAGQKYNDGVRSQIEQQINPFKSKIMRGLYDLNSNALETEDFVAVRTKYATSLAGYLKANGADASIFSDPNNELLVKAREYATKQAEYSAFHEDSKLATMLSQASSKLRNVDSDSTFENIAAHTASNMIEGLVPFKKTPMNVLRSGIEYSPLNTVQDLNKLYKVLRGKDGVKTADYLDSVTKTMTGTAIFALGAALFDKGLLQTKDEETQYQDQLEGKQNYSIKIGNKTYTIDNFAPFVMPLFAGAETKKAWDNRNGSVEKFWNLITSGNFDADALLNATGEIANGAASVANGITNPIVETSMLQGVQNTMEDVGRAVQENDSLGVLGTLVTNPLISYGTQVVPTLSGQLARTVDNTRRSTYTDKTGFAGSLERQGRRAMNKIPGLSKFNEPYVDTYGRTEKNSPYNNPVANAAYQFLSPSYVDDLTSTRADRSARELFEKTGDAKVFADKKTSKKIDGQKISPEDYTKYSQISGNANKTIREKIAIDKNFKTLSLEQQKEILSKVDTVSDKIGEAVINRNFKSDDDVYEAYLNGREKGVANYLIDKALLNQGASVYKDKNGKSKSFSSCSLQQQSEIVNKLVNQGKMTKSQAAKYMKDTDKFIIQDGNTKQTLEEKYGTEGANLYFDLTQNALNEKGSMTTQSVLPYLESKGVSQNLAGDVLYSLTNNSEKVDTINSELGSSGVYQYYKYKTYADYDGNGSLKKDEITTYLNSLGLTQDQKRYWFSKLASARTKNPY